MGKGSPYSVHRRSAAAAPSGLCTRTKTRQEMLLCHKGSPQSFREQPIPALGRDTVKGHSEHTQEPGWPCHGQTASLGAGFDVLLGCSLCVSLRKMRERQINPCPARDCSRKSCSVFLGYRLQKDAGSPGGNPTLGIQPCCHLSPAYGTRENPSRQLGNISMECEEHCLHLRL